MAVKQVLAGHKANLKNPNTSEDSKQNSRQVLEQAGIHVEDPEATEDGGEDKDPKHVAAGLKGAIKNPNVSEEAKTSAQERLDELDESDQE